MKTYAEQIEERQQIVIQQATAIREATSRWEAGRLRALKLAKSMMDRLVPALSDLGLEVTNFGEHQCPYPQGSQDWTPNSHLKVTLHLHSTGSFRFLAFDGYDSRGAGRNQKRLEQKACKLEDAVLKATGFTVSVNPISLEKKVETKTGPVLMSFSVS